MNNVSLYLQSFIYIVAGLTHFINPKMYVAIVPPYVPAPQFMVAVSGLAEIVLGIGLLFPATRSISAWGIIVLLIAVFPANIYMVTSSRFRKFPVWLRWARLPIQGFLIWWVYQLH